MQAKGAHAALLSNAIFLQTQMQMDMEEVFLSLGLDIIGLGVFNYDFKSITKESPVIKARSGVPWRMLLQHAADGLCFASLRC